VNVLDRVGRWLVEPPPVPALLDSHARVSMSQERVRPARPVVAVVGLAPGCGATTLTRALAAALARRDHTGAAIVAGAGQAPASKLSTRGAARLAARFSFSAQAAGRLCLISHDLDPAFADLAPVIGEVAEPAAGAHLTILVAPGALEPALAELAARNYAQTGREPLTVVTGVADSARWEERAFAFLPRSRVDARLAAAGWEPRGALAAAVARLVDACEEAACA
jgi:hypothetical protein